MNHHDLFALLLRALISVSLITGVGVGAAATFARGVPSTVTTIVLYTVATLVEAATSSHRISVGSGLASASSSASSPAALLPAPGLSVAAVGSWAAEFSGTG